MEEMREEIFYLEADDDYLKCCGEMFLTIKGHMVFHCGLCEMKYRGFKRYCAHLKGVHHLDTDECSMEENDVSEIVENCPREMSTGEDTIAKFIEIEPTPYDDDGVEIKNELIDDETSIEVLEEDALLVSGLLKTEMITTMKEHNIRNTSRKNIFTSKDKTSHKLKEVYHTENDCKTKDKTKTLLTKDTFEEELNDCSKALSESQYVSTTNINNSLVGGIKSIIGLDELDSDFYHELPSCDRPTLKRSRKPVSSLTDEERKHKCPYCPFGSKDKTNLWSHIQRHSNNKPYQCTYCPKNFHTRVELTFHTRYHTGERPFLCTECGRTFVTKEQLKQHMKRHNNQRDHKCSNCHKCFFSSQEVREHMTVHTKETPFKCDLCDGVFTRKKALNAHKKLHENKRSYKCKLCGDGFNQSAGLYLHMKTKHQVSKRI